MKRDVIIQARMGSTRLPEKVLFPLQGKTILAHVVARAKRIPGVDDVCVAVPDDADQAPIVAEAERAGAVVFKGSEHDVLSRYYHAAKALKSDIVTRVTSDCPLLDPELSGAIMALLEFADVDYAVNNMPLTWPHGTETETFTFDMLAQSQARAQSAFDREHVTVLMRFEDGVRRANLLSDLPLAVTNMRWTLDYPDDFTFLEKVFALTGPEGPTNLQQTMDLMNAHPDIAAINAAHGHYDAEEPEVDDFRYIGVSPYRFEKV